MEIVEEEAQEAQEELAGQVADSLDGIGPQNPNDVPRPKKQKLTAAR